MNLDRITDRKKPLGQDWDSDRDRILTFQLLLKEKARLAGHGHGREAMEIEENALTTRESEPQPPTPPLLAKLKENPNV